MKLKTPKPVVVDFETEGITPRPLYPPKPVGISIKYPGKAAHYYAFGHPTENNCTEAFAKKQAYAAWKNPAGISCQNAKFDIDVAEVHWDLKVPAWDKVHDTQFLIFLDDPNQQTFSLKPSAERILKMKPDEQDAVRDWLLEHQPLKDKGIKISASKKSEHYFGRYICLAPGKLVGDYANGDTVRTERIFDKLWPKCVKRGMLAAYDRERKLMPILLEMERQGVPVHHGKLKRDITFYRKWLGKVERWLHNVLKDDDVDLGSGEQLVAACIRAKKLDPRRLPRTPTGKPQFNKVALAQAVTDTKLLAVLKYRTQLKTCLQTFMEPWAQTCERSIAKGLVPKAMRSEGLSLIFTSWNQVKGDGRAGNAGARTGRLSSTPNFQNIPKEFAAIFMHEAPKAKPRLPALPSALRGLPPLPRVRSYIAPFPGEVLIDRDYSQQEPRILAHFDGGVIMQRYIDNPWMDFHDQVREELAKAGLHYERKPVKNTGLGLIYGMGVGTLAERSGLEVKEAKTLKDAILRILPGLKSMYREAKLRAASNKPVRTWGGREYYCEPPKVVDGRWRQYDYKLVNVLIQGSAADCTKEAIIRYHEAKGKATRLLFNVHDQLTASTPRPGQVVEMEKMRKAMESVEFDVQILTEGSTSDESLEDLEPYDKKGERLRKAA